MFHQPDLFDHSPSVATAPVMSDLVERVSLVSKRPRYALLVLNLIAKAAQRDGSLGPYVSSKDGTMPVRDWLCSALAPLAQRDCRRIAMVEAVRVELASASDFPADPSEAEARVNAEIRSRILRSGRTNISRAVSDLVRAGLLHRYYKGYRVDHPNRGAGREAVYTLAPAIAAALMRN